MIRNALLIVLAFTCPALGHDTWVETNTNVIRTGDAVYVDLKLGNHGNDHRDFKLASKIELGDSTLDVLGPDGSRYELKSRPAMSISSWPTTMNRMSRVKTTRAPSIQRH